MRRSLFAIALGSLLLAACRGSPADGGADTSKTPPPPPMASLVVADPSGGTGPFSVAKLDRLVIAVDAARFKPGTHAVRVDVSGPGGILYTQLPAQLVVSDGGTGRATTGLQIRGSVIASFRDTGRWELVAYIDGMPFASAGVDLTE